MSQGVGPQPVDLDTLPEGVPPVLVTTAHSVLDAALRAGRCWSANYEYYDHDARPAF